MLFNQTNDRTATMLAWHVAHTPWPELTKGAKDLIVWRKKAVYPKARILNFLNEEQTHLLVLNKSQLSSSFGTLQEFRIVWKHDNVPTEIEWERKSEGYLIDVDLRITKPHGRIALFSF
jgi:hypothetical protein